MERKSFIRFWIGNEEFLITEFSDDKWGWSSNIDESKKTFDSMLDAQLDAIRAKTEEATEKREERIAILEAEVFGTYEEQVRMDYESKIRS